ncbi:MAG: tyrosine--tRNA ligase [Parachlamydiales bacterium]|nr:tyrosine--tRNA ligase [Parachlamydiales bacterium]
MSNLIEVLEKRGFIDQVSDNKIKHLLENPTSIYVGFDPTADSLHIGNLVGIIALYWFKKFGHNVYALVGGATGRIGDPSGKSLERPFLDDQIISNNIKAIEKQLKFILGNDIQVINNNDWFKEINFVDFLRDIGKQFRIGPMLSKESVKLRMESEIGMSFTEFSYQLLQAYDFYYLHKHSNIILQMGGSDQWGNITAGIELIRKLTHKTAYGMTFPLLTRSDGKKFGKSEEGAIWLDKDKLSFYQFYQYFIRLPDSDVIKILKMLTFLDIKDIEALENEMNSSSYESNTVQKILADEVTRIVHKQEGLDIALKVTKTAAPGSETKLDKEALIAISNDMPNANLTIDEIIGVKFVDISVKINLTSSKSEATRLVKNGGAYLNNNKVTDPNLKITQKDLIDDLFLLFGSGKKKKILVQVIEK